jgi:hypothetical protein
MTMRMDSRLRLAAGVLLAASGMLAACDAPLDPGGAVPGGPSLLVTPACAGTGGTTHAGPFVNTAQTWTRAGSPHRIPQTLHIAAGGRVTVAPGAAVCFEPGAALYVYNGGRLLARGRDTAQVLFTARDPARGWSGLQFYPSPGVTSILTNVRVEHADIDSDAVYADAGHAVILDSAVIRQSGSGVVLLGPGSRISRSRVDSMTNRGEAAVSLGGGARFEQSVVRDAAGVGVRVLGDGVLLLGGRIEGSGGTGLQFVAETPLGAYFKPLRIVGGGGYPAEIPASILARTYATPALQDSLRGNARDTVVVMGGVLQAALTAGPRIPFLVTGSIAVEERGSVVAQPGARLAFRPGVGMGFQNGGRLWARGTAAAPVVLTADDRARGWDGMAFHGYTISTSYLTNARIEHVRLAETAVEAWDFHRVIVDSSVIRQTGRAVVLNSGNSRLMRTRVDTTLNSDGPAVVMGAGVRLESTRITAPAGPGIAVYSGGAVVASCEVRYGDGAGIELYAPADVHNCNLVNNGGPGIRNRTSTVVSATGNWWGSTGGPHVTGGDGAEGPLTVSPWRTTPFVLPYLP